MTNKTNCSHNSCANPDVVVRCRDSRVVFPDVRCDELAPHCDDVDELSEIINNPFVHFDDAVCKETRRGKNRKN